MTFSKRGGALALGVAMIVGLGCSSSSSGGTGTLPPGTVEPGDPGTPRTAGPTAVGTPTAPPRVAKVGAAGGTLESADKRVKLIVPPGALASEVELKMTPLTNETPLGLGYAVRLEPDGTTFAVPAKLVFAYGAWGGSTAPELLLGATQGPDKSWTIAGGSVLDTAAKTLTVDLPHFSDWSLGACAALTASTYVLVAGQEAALAVEEQCEQPLPGLMLGGISRTSHQVGWGKRDRAGNPGPGQLKDHGSTATLVGEAVTGDPLVTISAEWRSPRGTRVFTDDIATNTTATFTIEGVTVNSEVTFLTTHQGKTSINASSKTGTFTAAVRLTGVGTASTDPAGGEGLVANGVVGDTDYFDDYIIPCTNDIRYLETTVTIGRANRERQYITGTWEGTLGLVRGEVTCNSSPTPGVEHVAVTGTFYAIWQNLDMAFPPSQ